MKINYSYDKDVDSLFIYLDEDYNYDESIELTPNIIMDFDVNSYPVAVEILSASILFKIDKESFDNIENIVVHIEIDEDIIKLTVILTIINNDDLIINSKCINDFKAPIFNTELAIV